MIDVDDLRVGMYIHLDLGWMSHPFPLSSFKIASAQQLATLRSLGLTRVRWSPQQSDPAADHHEVRGPAPAGHDDVPAATPAPVCAIAGGRARADTAVEPGASRTAAPVAHADPARSAPGSAATDPAPAAPDRDTGRTSLIGALDGPGPSTASRSASGRRRALAAQRVALRVAERQFSEASKACRQVNELALVRPQEARAQAEALAGAIADKMAGEQELCIRLLTEAAGDKISMHAINVALISLLMGRAFGFTQAEMIDLGSGALLHDMGKLEMPLRARHPDDTFTPLEQREYEQHVAHGLALARRMGLSPGATLIVAQHHEHADGSGFPLRLNTDRMTPASRIVGLVNRYDNLCNPYFLAKGLTPHEALSQLFAQGKSKYDTSILGGFIRMMGVYPPGSAVQLTDDRYALVVTVNSTRPLKPCVLVHDPAVPREDALIVDLEHAPDLGIRRSLRPTQLPPPALDYLAPRQRVAYYFEPAGVAEPA